jgi:hypothetical protein
MDTRGFYRQHPEWSIVGKNTWDIMRSVDFLQTLDFVDRANIGSIGWSLGGQTVLFAAAFEPRITATVTNGGVLDWHRKTKLVGSPGRSPEQSRARNDALASSRTAAPISSFANSDPTSRTRRCRSPLILTAS